MWEKSHKKREKERVLKMTKKSRKIGHYSETTGPNKLKFCLVLGFRQGIGSSRKKWFSSRSRSQGKNWLRSPITSWNLAKSDLSSRSRSHSWQIIICFKSTVQVINFDISQTISGILNTFGCSILFTNKVTKASPEIPSSKANVLVKIVAFLLVEGGQHELERELKDFVHFEMWLSSHFRS